ncbi:hypothetical protein EDC04DRAFT_2069200 [Pisolithus marmoratus]|nr:hypothetical protein EDC04DRAFT_2069200 [Pisolithus marmoratus]
MSNLILLLLALLVICTSCLFFILWRRTNILQSVVSHPLEPWSTAQEGRVRLSEDDGPAATEFLADADDETPVRLTDFANMTHDASNISDYFPPSMDNESLSRPTAAT